MNFPFACDLTLDVGELVAQKALNLSAYAGQIDRFAVQVFAKARCSEAGSGQCRRSSSNVLRRCAR